jgi:putative ABC transport system substrate-binding protein
MNLAQDDPQSKAQISAFVQALQGAGWEVGRNLQIDYRWTEGDASRIRKFGAELLAATPDVILTAGASHVGPLEQMTSAVPIVFVQVTDPVGGGLIESLAHPGVNSTGFTVFEYDISAKWLELLKQIAPRMNRIGVLRDPNNPSGTGLFGGIQAVASTFNVEATPIGLRDAKQIENGVASFAAPNSGLIVTPSSLALVFREEIVRLAAQHRLPTVYPFGYFVTSGGLVSYGPDVVDQFRRAAAYVDRILRGERAAELPVQRSTKLELLINLRTAKTLGVAIPDNLVVRADSVIR